MNKSLNAKSTPAVTTPIATPPVRANLALAGAVRPGNFRWTICALLFFAATINYIDRQVLGLLAPDLEKTFGWNEAQYGYIVLAFQTAYASGFLLSGAMMDRIGLRRGFSVSVAFWSVAAMAHALAGSVFGFGAARFALGLGESGNFPAAIKTVAEWFPKKERALATGIFNAGTNIGAIIVPLTVPFIVIRYGWRWAFVLTGASGLIWVAFWLAIYRRPEEHRRLSAAEFDYIRSDPPEPTTKTPLVDLLPHRQMWAFGLAKFLTDPIWWFYLFWLPKFLHKTYGLTIETIGAPLIVIYLAADVGSIGGGWLSSTLIKRGWPVNTARKTAMLICAIAVTPIIFASRASNEWVAVALIGLATAAHQGWSANVFTMSSDLFPRRVVGSVVGVGGLGGAVGGMLIAAGAGLLLQYTDSYLPLFIIAGSAYLVALALIQILAPRYEPAPIDGASA